MRVPRSVVAVGAAVSLTLFAAACGGDDDDDDTSAATTETTAASTETSAASDVTTAAEYQDYVGLTEADATAKAEADGKVSRVVERDGESLPATMDYNPERLNFAITDGKVTGVTTG